MDADRKRILLKVATDFLSKISFGDDHLTSHTPSHAHGRNKPHPIRVVRHAWNIAKVTVGSVSNLDGKLLYSTINVHICNYSWIGNTRDDQFSEWHL